MDTADDEIEFGESIFGKIHSAVAEDIAFEAGEDAEGQAVPVEFADVAGKIDHAPFVEAVGHGEGFGVVGDGDVLVAQGGGSFGHFAERGFAVAFGGVHVEIAAHVAEFDQFRKAIGAIDQRSGIKFARVFAEFGRNPGVAKAFVDFGFAGPGYTLIIFDREEAVFVERETLANGGGAERDIVLLAAGEVLQGSSEVFRTEGANVHLQAVEAEKDAGFVGAFAEHFLCLRMMDDVVQGGDRVGTGDEDVEVADRVAATAEAAGGFDAFNPGERPEFLRQFPGDTDAIGKKEAARAFSVSLNGAEDFFFEFGTHAGESAELLLAADAFEVVDGLHAVVLVEKGDAFGTEALDFEQLQGGGRVFREHFIAAVKGAAGADFLDDKGETFADTGDAGDFAAGITEHVADAFGVAEDRGGAVTVAANAEAIFSGDFHEVRGFGEKAGNFLVFHGS